MQSYRDSINWVNSKQKRTFSSILADPISASIAWKDIESLFIALGAEIIEGSGSRVRFHKEGVVASFHRPHPKKEAKPYQVKDARAFLKQLGVKP
jgi:hypothetical protein